MKRFEAIHNGKNKRVIGIECMGCCEVIYAVTEIKDSGTLQCGCCGNVHKVTVYKNGKMQVTNESC